MIYAPVIQKIKEILQTVDQVQEVFASPLGKDKRASKYPAVIFIPGSISSSFSDSASNHREIGFTMWVVVNSNNVQSTEVFERILPNVVDAVINAFDTGWNFGTSIDGHRTWARVSSGDWGLSVEEKSIEAWAELKLVVQLDVPV